MAPHMVQQWQVKVFLRVSKLLWLYLLDKALNDADWGGRRGGVFFFNLVPDEISILERLLHLLRNHTPHS